MFRVPLPFVIAAILIVVLTLVEGIYMKDRWGSPGAEAGELGQRFAKVPKEIGGWVGQDLPVDELVQKTAGAVNYVNRSYTHGTTGEVVRLWLIVGHSRDIVRHTPSACYPASGFRQVGSRLRHHVDTKEGQDAVFFTAKFEKEDPLTHQIERVFWAWNHPDKNKWESPENSGGNENARMHYGLSRALYKMYFTGKVRSTDETVEENSAAEFAELMLPAIDAALFPKIAPADTSATEAETAALESGTTG